MSRDDILGAVKVAIDTQFVTPRAVEIDKAAARTGDHIVVFLSRRYVDGRLMSGEARTDGWRLITRYVGRTSANVRAMQDRTRAAVEEKFLPGDVGPFSFEAEQETLDYDSDVGGWYTAADAWIT